VVLRSTFAIWSARSGDLKSLILGRTNAKVVAKMQLLTYAAIWCGGGQRNRKDIFLAWSPELQACKAR
jgi:hypothetical protein